jgi:hypothetical protein
VRQAQGKVGNTNSDYQEDTIFKRAISTPGYRAHANHSLYHIGKEVKMRSSGVS